MNKMVKIHENYETFRKDLSHIRYLHLKCRVSSDDVTFHFKELGFHFMKNKISNINDWIIIDKNCYVLRYYYKFNKEAPCEILFCTGSINI